MSNDTLRPEYYNTDSVYEPIKIIQHYGLCFEISNVLKYCLRAGVKNTETEIEDLIKAKTYLQLRIDYLESQKSQNFKKGGIVLGNSKPRIENDSELKPKLISELKIGDEIKAIDPWTMHDHGVKEIMGDALIIGNNYKIKRIYGGKLDIRSEVYDVHTFDLMDLHEYFHVSKE